MSLNDVLHQCQPQPHSAVLPPAAPIYLEERFKDAFLHIARNTGTRILDPDMQVRRRHLGPQDHLSLFDKSGFCLSR